MWSLNRKNIFKTSNSSFYNETEKNYTDFSLLGDFLSNGTTDEYIFDDPPVRLFFYFAYTVVFCLCILGNLIVLVVVIAHWRMRSITKFCMGNLAFANLCVGVFCIYQNLSTFLSENWEFGRLLCKMYYFTNSLSHTASILILVVICVERYLAIINPFHCRRILTIQRLRLTLVAVWLISAAICAPRLYYITTFEAPLLTGVEEQYEVICAPKRTLYNSRTADMVYFVLLFIIPLSIMSILYARIGAVIWKTSVALHSPHPETAERFQNALNSCGSQNQRLPHPPNNSFVTSSPGKKNSKGGERCSRPSSSSSHGLLPQNPGHTRSSYKNEENFVQSLHRHLNYERTASVEYKVSPPRRYAVKCHQSGSSSTSVLTRNLIQVKDERHGRVLRSRQAVIRMLIVLVTSFTLCNFPYHLRKICQYYVPNYNVQGYFNQIFTPLTFLLMYTNCAINPILYAFMSKTFRLSLREVMRCDFRRRCKRNDNNGAFQRRLSV